MPRRTTVRALLVALLAGTLLPFGAASAATAAAAHEQVVDLTFPVRDPDGLTTFSDDYHSPRSRGDHGATDIGGAQAYGLTVHAAVGGTVRRVTGVGSDLPSYGWMISITGDDGRTYNYLHLGRQDGPVSEAYAPGIDRGVRVERGQHIGFVGHSGNASASWPHLHLEIEDPAVTDPQGTNRINPYNSLVAAIERGDLPGGVPGFSDVAVGHTHASGISRIADAGVTTGCAPYLFCPDRAVSRAQMATFLTRALDLPASDRVPYGDVASDHPHRAGIGAVTAAGIARGLSGGRFAPAEPVRRDQMASFLAAAYGLEHRPADFADVGRESPHHGAIGAMAEAGITRGVRGGGYAPRASVTRAQMATFLSRAMDLEPEPDPEPTPEPEPTPDPEG